MGDSDICVEFSRWCEGAPPAQGEGRQAADGPGGARGQSRHRGCGAGPGLSAVMPEEEPVAESGKDDGEDAGAKWMVVKNLPGEAKGYAWFKKYGSVGTVHRANFYGFRKGQVRWCVAECGSAEQAAALVKELDGTDAGGEKPLSARAIDTKEKADIAKQGKEPAEEKEAAGKTGGDAPDEKAKEKLAVLILI